MGSVFSTGDPFTDIDLDGCVDSRTGDVAVWHFAEYEVLAVGPRAVVATPNTKASMMAKPTTVVVALAIHVTLPSALLTMITAP